MNISVSRDGQEIGEWTDEEVRTLYFQGSLLPTDHYWREGMAQWSTLSTFIKPPPPASEKPSAVAQLAPGKKTTQFVPALQDLSSVGSVKVAALPPLPVVAKPKSEGKAIITGKAIAFFIGLVIIRQTVSVPSINPDEAFIAGAFIALIYYGFVWMVFRVFDRNGKLSVLITAGFIILVAVIVVFDLAGSRQATPGFEDLPTTLLRNSKVLNAKMPIKLDGVTEMESTSVGPPLTFHYHYTYTGDVELTPDIVRLKIRPALISDLQGQAYLQSLRNQGVSFEYDYFKPDGTPIIQVLIGPNDYI
jgi:hypothetical protein